MGLREFSDRDGVLWRVWDVTAESMDRRTATEDYMRDWQDGWLAFESATARRRLAHYPSDWMTLAPDALEQLLARAQEVRRRSSGEVAARPEEAEP